MPSPPICIQNNLAQLNASMIQCSYGALSLLLHMVVATGSLGTDRIVCVWTLSLPYIGTHAERDVVVFCWYWIRRMDCSEQTRTNSRYCCCLVSSVIPALIRLSLLQCKIYRDKDATRANVRWRTELVLSQMDIQSKGTRTSMYELQTLWAVFSLRTDWSSLDRINKKDALERKKLWRQNSETGWLIDKKKRWVVATLTRFELARPKPLDDWTKQFKSNPLTTLAQCRFNWPQSR